MNILINNKSVVTTAHNVQKMVAELSLPQTGVAVAIDNKMVPRTQWNDTALYEGANVVIIKAACGG